ncbi:hypothetical protein CEUSTIGMA_g8048.t1 [Chlamydomonas eustigma]|uniref:Transmembrane protein 19 n=1 Tax=Chlamydomonas eustigma TaxID=1157962 RepID=A0A250XC06_9CHLO|nr:hypothetical protein CEUSTIGMA_g8048.t1 [Chlamydomonas eustigma]|eukprot:GAX80613.1 hypothetical protein CEUSTIGMA_g8048.t1 [Chlamydomonas eustigma]
MIWLLFSFLVAGTLAGRGFVRKSLSQDGALAAVFVGTLHMYCGLQYGMTLIFFYLSSSKLTRLQGPKKASLEEGFKPGGQRDAVQVLANSFGACACLIGIVLMDLGLSSSRWKDSTILTSALSSAFLGHYCCCCADTWASEVGILNTSWPRLITTLQPVPPGTNGGVSLLGTLSSLAGALSVGGVYCIAVAVQQCVTVWINGTEAVQKHQIPGHDLSHMTVMLMSGALGVGGCLLDSLLGATLQFSGVDMTSNKVTQKLRKGVRHICGTALLSNDAVNFISAAMTSFVGGYVATTLLSSE